MSKIGTLVTSRWTFTTNCCFSTFFVFELKTRKGRRTGTQQNKQTAGWLQTNCRLSTVCFLCIALRRNVEATIPAMMTSHGCQGNARRAPVPLHKQHSSSSCGISTNSTIVRFVMTCQITSRATSCACTTSGYVTGTMNRKQIKVNLNNGV